MMYWPDPPYSPAGAVGLTTTQLRVAFALMGLYQLPFHTAEQIVVPMETRQRPPDGGRPLAATCEYARLALLRAGWEKGD